jgi:DNA modification methylase
LAQREAVNPPPASFFTLHRGDARRLEALLAPYSSQQEPLLTCTITSPPYADLKDYGDPDQIGWGQAFDEYLVECRRVFRAIAKHTKPEGSMWLIADTLQDQQQPAPTPILPLPFQLAEEAKQAGWTLRDIIIWRKDRTIPWTTRGQLRDTFEYILFFVKTESFKYHVDRIRDPVKLTEWWVQYPERYNPQGKVPTNVWDIPILIQGSWASSAIKHACPLPYELVERLVLLSTDKGDVVFDPFAGTGVVVAEAERLGRRGLGIELVRKYYRAFHKVVRQEILQGRGEDELAKRAERSDYLRDVIPKLRALKYPKTLWNMLRTRRPELPVPTAAVALLHAVDPDALRLPHRYINTTSIFLLERQSDEREAVQRALKDLAQQQPASKFGVDGDIVVTNKTGATSLVGSEQLSLYRGGNTWMSVGITTIEDLSRMEPSGRGEWLPIAGNVEIAEKPRPLD